MLHYQVMVFTGSDVRMLLTYNWHHFLFSTLFKLHHESTNWPKMKWKLSFRALQGYYFKERMFKAVQIISILNSSKNWVMKWSVHSEKVTFTREVAGNQRVISNSLQMTQKYQSIEVVQLYKTQRKMAECYSVLSYFQFFNNFWRYLRCTFICLFPAQLSSLANKQPVGNHMITDLTTWCFIIINRFSNFHYFRYFKALFA